MSMLPLKHIPAFSSLLKSIEAHITNRGYVRDIRLEQEGPLNVMWLDGTCVGVDDMSGDITLSITLPATNKMRKAMKEFRLELLKVSVGEHANE